MKDPTTHVKILSPSQYREGSPVVGVLGVSGKVPVLVCDHFFQKYFSTGRKYHVHELCHLNLLPRFKFQFKYYNLTCYKTMWITPSFLPRDAPR
jgi:hypothetical protein